MKSKPAAGLPETFVAAVLSFTSMRSFSAKPASPVLKRLVKSLHCHEADFPFALERIMPNGQAHLLVNLAEDGFRTYGRARLEEISEHSGAIVAGPHARSVVIDTEGQRWLASVEFRHGAACQFFEMPMTEISDHVVGIRDVWPRDGAWLRERLLEAPSPSAKLCVLEKVLLAHLKVRSDPAIEYAIAALEAGLSVSGVAARLGLSARTLERRFSRQVGITPKRFARVGRLQRVLARARGSRKPDWCRLAAEHGFTDQAHLIHDFRELADITPTEYKPHSPERNNHVPILAR
ncbi:MAG: helix-turn-helix transcriptional regulator [Acidobacteria bacterium]|nr:helix-turn-helix transcriptional regulator [Acidobacteriota bacterium]